MAKHDVDLFLKGKRNARRLCAGNCGRTTVTDYCDECRKQLKDPPRQEQGVRTPLSRVDNPGGPNPA